MYSVADPPGPVKISHKKDGGQRRPHRFHVSRPTALRSRWICYWCYSMIGFMVHSHCSSSGSSGWVRGAKKHEIYAAAFGSHLFYNLFSQGRGRHGPLAPPRVYYCVVAMAVERTKNSTFLLPLPSQCEQYNLLP